MYRRASLTPVELDLLMAEFDKIEHDIVNLGNILGLAYGPAWSGRALRPDFNSASEKHALRQ